MSTAVPLGATLAAAKAAGRKALVPYITGGLDLPGCRWTDLLAALVDAGADAVEIGIPFSDPVMDGPVIQEASQRALDDGATPVSILAELGQIEAGVPLAAMTYGNLAYAPGWERFAADLHRVGITGAILPDLPLEESGPWEAATAAVGVDAVLLAAPVTPDERLVQICARSRGFVYAVATMGVTGARSEVAASAARLARRMTALTPTPVLVGFGVSNAQQAVEVAAAADGVIVGSALLREVLGGASAAEAAALIGSMRKALDDG